MITVACVYKQEPVAEYGLADVVKLMRAVSRNITVDHHLLLLTDASRQAARHDAGWPDVKVEVRSLHHNWRGWWSKMELFRLSGPVLYFDLDTVITGNIDDLAQAAINSDKLIQLRGFYKADRCTGIMGWGDGVDLSWITDAFNDDLLGPPEYIDQSFALHMRCRSGIHRGDQEWLDQALRKRGIETRFVQDLFPGVYSYKVHVQGKSLPEDARVVCFHGRPRPHEVVDTEPWMQEHRMHACHDHQG